MPTIVGVRFKPTGKTYYFDPKGTQFKKGEGAIVETSRGAEFAIVVIENKEVPDSQIVGELKPVINKATQADITRNELNLQRKPEIMRIVREKIENHGLDMHLKDMDFSYDNSKMTFYYSADDRVDFRELVKDLGATLRTRVELRQIGIRDETKMLGGLGSCGRPCCCSSFLNGFERVSIKMAKVQGLSLNPVNISGLCGRLMCCLKYENEHYLETSKIMPKLNETVTTPDGDGKVEAIDALRRDVKVMFNDENGNVSIKTYNVTELNLTQVQMQGADIDDDEDDLADEELVAVEQLIEEKQFVEQMPKEKTRNQSKPHKEGGRQEKSGKTDKLEKEVNPDKQDKPDKQEKSEKQEKQRQSKRHFNHGSNPHSGNGNPIHGEQPNKKKDRLKKEHQKPTQKPQEAEGVEEEEKVNKINENQGDKKPHKKHRKHKHFNKNKGEKGVKESDATQGE